MAQYGPFYAENYSVGTKLSSITGFTPAHDAATNDDVEVMEATVDGVTFRYWRPVGSSGNKPYTYDPAGDVHDMEMLCQMYIVDDHNDTVLGHAQADMPDSDTYYRIGLRARRPDAERFDNGVFSSIAEGDIFSGSAAIGQYMFMRCQRDGSNLRVRLFGLNDDYDRLRIVPDEPTAWDLETTDSNITADGKVGVGWRADNGQGVLWFSFGTAGDPAPTPEGDLTGTVTIDDATPDSSTAVDVQWSYNQTNQAGFHARVDGGEIQDLGDPSPKEDRVTGLSPSTTYNSPGLELRAYNALGETTAWSSPATFTTPATTTPTFARTNQTVMVQSKAGGEDISAGTGTRYIPIAASSESGSIIGSARKPITDAVKVSKVSAVVLSNTTAGDAVLRLVDDDANTSIAVTIPAGQTGTFTDDTNEHTFNGTTEGYWIVEMPSGSGSLSILSISAVLEPTDENAVISWIGPLSAGEDAFGSSATIYKLPIGTRGGETDESEAQLSVPFPATVRDLRAAGSNNSTTDFTGTAEIGFRKNGVDTAVTATWDSANQSGGSDMLMVVENLVDSEALNAEDDLSIFVRPDAGAAGSTRDVKWYGTLESDNSEDGNGDRTGEFLLAVGNPGGNVPFNDIEYAAVAGEFIYVATESNAQIPVTLACNLFRFSVRTSKDNTGSGVVTLMRNGVATDLSIEVSGEASTVLRSPIDLVEAFSADDLASYKIEEGGGTLDIQHITVAGAVLDPTAGPVDLTAQDIATGAPSVGSASLTQAHSLVAQDVSAGAPTLEQASLDGGVTHGLTAQDTATSAPVVGSAAIGQVHNLAADGVAAGSPVIVNATITQNHDLSTQAVASPAPTIGSPSLSETSQDHSLAAQSVSTGSPVVGSPTLEQAHSFVAVDTVTTAPSVDGAVISQLHELASADVATSDPVIANASLDVNSHSLSAQDVATAEPVIDSPTMALALSGQFFRAMSLSKESELTINITDKG